MKSTRILGTGSYLPPKVLTNYDLEEKGLDTTHDWIVKRTGVSERRIADEGVTTSDLGSEAALKALEMAGIDVAGLDAQDRRYLETLIRVFGGGPTGVEALSHTMNTSSDTLQDEVEPYLLRSELIVRTARGRVATANAYEHLRLPPPHQLF